MNMERSGFLLIDKPAGITSHDVVGRVRRLYGTRRVGHTGTLDPLATGLLVILVGRAAKAAEYLTVKKKSYRAVLRLGLTTDTEDVTGQILTTSKDIPSKEQVIGAAESFVGEILQTPPMYSALKVGGQKLVDLARKGVEIERKPRPVAVYSLICDHLEDQDYTLQVTCSAGTYIRTLCADIGKKLGCGGVMAALRRTETGEFSLEESITLEQLEALDEEARLSRLMPIDSLFGDLPAVRLPAFYERLCRSGCEIYQKKIGVNFPLATRVRLCNTQGQFFALGEVCEYAEGLAIKPLKQFDI